MSTEADKQEILRKFVDNHILKNEGMLVEDLLKEGKFDYEDIENYLKGEYWCEKCDIETPHDNGYCDICGDYTDEQEPQEIMEWWSCTDWLIEKLKNEGEPILRTDYGDYWGRTCTGQAIYMDWVMEKIYDDMKIK